LLIKWPEIKKRPDKLVVFQRQFHQFNTLPQFYCSEFQPRSHKQIS
jgi:hypothetical protein